MLAWMLGLPDANLGWIPWLGTLADQCAPSGKLKQRMHTSTCGNQGHLQ